MKKSKTNVSLSHRILSVVIAGIFMISTIPSPVWATGESDFTAPTESVASEASDVSTPSDTDQTLPATDKTPASSDAAESSQSSKQGDTHFVVRFLDYSDNLIGQPQEVPQGGSAVAPSQVPAPSGQQFKSWSTDAYLDVQSNLDVKALYVPLADPTTSPKAKSYNTTTKIWAEDLFISDTTKEYGTTDPRPTLAGMPSNLKDGVDYYVEYTRTAGEDVSSRGYKVTIKTFRFINPNYTLQGDPCAIKEGCLYITTRKITITANSASKTYDGTNLTNSGYTISGSGLATGNTATVAISGSQKNVGSSANTVGSVTIRNSSNVNVTSCYTITKVNGILTVTQAPLTITADNKAISYNDLPPAYTMTYTGFVNGETKSVLTSQATASCSYSQGNAPGAYPITCSGAAGANYNITYQPGTLTVHNNGIQITVTAGSASKTYDGTPLTSSAYIQTGLPAGFTLNVTISGSVTTVAGSTPGNNVVTGVVVRNSLNQDVTAYFPNIITAPGTLTITPAPLTANVADVSINYGDPTPTFTVSYSGFVNGETQSIITTPISYTCSYTQGSAPGSYGITGSGAVAANYTVNYLPGVLTVCPNNTLITVTAASDSKTYDGMPLTEDNYTVTGLPAGYTVTADVTGTATAVADSIPGNNVISNVVIRDNSSQDVTAYFSNIVMVNGSLSILPAALTAEMADLSISYNDPAPLYPVSYSGFVSGETIAVLLTPTIASCSYTQGDAPGAYNITGSGATAANYTVNYLPGVLTVHTNGAQITVTAASQSKTYDGSALTDHTYITTGLPMGYTLTAIVTGTATNVADTTPGNNLVSGIKIYNALSQDVTAFFPNVVAVPGTLSILPAPLTAEMKDYVIVFDDPAPIYGVTYTGFVNSETAAVLINQTDAICSYNQGDPAGSYPITGSGAVAANYVISYLAGTLTVAPDTDQITVLASYASKVYDGTPLTSSGYTVTGLPDGFTIVTSVTGSATNVIDSIAGNNIVGTVTILDDTMADVTSNFTNIVKVNGTLTITPATLVATMTNFTIEYMDPAPTYTTDYSGFVSGETIAVLTSQTIATCPYTLGDEVGTYPITGTGAAAANYTIIYQPGVLVEQMNNELITIVAGYDSKVYDGTALTKNSYTQTGTLPDGHTIEVTIAGSATDVADSVSGNNVITSVVIKNASDHDVTADFSNIVTVNGTLTITPANLLAQVSNASVQFTDPPPTYGVTYTGFVNSEDASVLTNPTAFNCAYAQGDPVGTYTITGSGATAANYTINYSQGSLDVTAYRGNITVVAAYDSKVYDGTSLVNSTFTVMGSLPEGYHIEATVVGSATNVADSITGNNVISNIVVKNALNADVTENFVNITGVNGTLTITPAPLTIDVLDKVIEFDDAPPVYNVNYIGFVNGETPAVLSGPATPTCSYIDGDLIGQYPITCTGVSAANYSISYLPGTLIVTPNNDQITVMAASASKQYDGSSLVDSTYTQTGLPMGYKMEVTVVGSATNVADSSAGNNVITSVIIRDADSQDVTADFANIVKVPGTLNITPAPLTVKLDDMTIHYCDAVPQYTATYTGFVNGETMAVLTHSVTMSGTYTKGDLPGEYDITGSEVAAANYTIYYQSGVLVVTANENLITVKSGTASKTYDGKPLEDHTYTYTGLPTGYTLEASTLTSVTNVNTKTPGNNVISGIVIKDPNNQDVTSSFSNIIEIPGTLTVTPKEATITADNLSKKVSEADPVLTAKVTGTVDGDVLNYTLKREPGEKIGSYPINVLAGDNPNYTVTVVPGTFTITAQPIVPITKSGEQGNSIMLWALLASVSGIGALSLWLSRKRKIKN